MTTDLIRTVSIGEVLHALNWQRLYNPLMAKWTVRLHGVTAPYILDWIDEVRPDAEWKVW